MQSSRRSMVWHGFQVFACCIQVDSFDDFDGYSDFRSSDHFPCYKGFLVFLLLRD